MWQLFTEKALRFRGENDDLPLAMKGVIFWCVDADRLKIVLEIDEDTTTEQLRDAIPYALQWRDRLLKWQGPQISGGKSSLLLELDIRKQEGESYAELAKALNQGLADKLREFDAYQKEFDAVKSQFKKWEDFYLWQSKSNPYSLEHARWLLQYIGFREDDITAILDEALMNIQNGNEPFTIKEYPVSKRKVERVLRTWRNSPKYKSLKEKKGR